MKHNEIEFKERVKKCLPENILVGDIKYRLDAHGLMSGGYRISYGEFNGDSFNWENKLIDLFFKIGEKPLEKPLPKEMIGISILSDASIFAKNIDEIISHCILKLNERRYEELDEIITKETEFLRELTSLLNRYSEENKSDTPDFILANYINGCLRNYNSIITQRENWFERGKRKEKDITDELQFGEQM